MLVAPHITPCVHIPAAFSFSSLLVLLKSRNLRCLEKREETASSYELIHAGAGRPCGTLFPWRGPGSSGGNDLRAGDSPLATPGNGCWLVVHSSHALPCPGDMRTRASVSRLLSRGA
jgi:hypothetical protein